MTGLRLVLLKRWVEIVEELWRCLLALPEAALLVLPMVPRYPLGQQSPSSPSLSKIGTLMEHAWRFDLWAALSAGARVVDHSVGGL